MSVVERERLAEEMLGRVCSGQCMSLLDSLWTLVFWLQYLIQKDYDTYKDIIHVRNLKNHVPSIYVSLAQFNNYTHTHTHTHTHIFIKSDHLLFPPCYQDQQTLVFF